MKSNFIYISTIIVVCLFIVFSLQLYSLVGIYNSIDNQTERSVIECLESADLDELQHRIDSLNNIPLSEKKSLHTLSKKMDFDEEQNLIHQDELVVVQEHDTLSQTSVYGESLML